MAAPTIEPRLTLNDLLSLERTRMSNERTVLAYLRTGLAIIIAGFSLIRFFGDGMYLWAGLLCMPLGLGIILLGWVRFRIKDKRMSQSVLNPNRSE